MHPAMGRCSKTGRQRKYQGTRAIRVDLPFKTQKQFAINLVHRTGIYLRRRSQQPIPTKIDAKLFQINGHRPDGQVKVIGQSRDGGETQCLAPSHGG